MAKYRQKCLFPGIGAPGRLLTVLFVSGVVMAGGVFGGEYAVYSSYLWHLQQPNYWPEKDPGLNRYLSGNYLIVPE